MGTNRRILGAATALVGAGAVSLMMAGTASAAVSSIDAAAPQGTGSVGGGYGTGCTYKFDVKTDDSTVVQYNISDEKGVAEPKTAPVVDGKATITFAPETAGTYTISARQADQLNDKGQITWVKKTVKVGNGIQVPGSSNTCLVTP